jgi:hypothetical protein
MAPTEPAILLADERVLEAIAAAPSQRIRIAVVAAIALFAGLFCGVGVAAFAGVRGAVLGAALASGLVAFASWKRLPFTFDEATRSPALLVVAAAATLLALIQVGREAGYMVDAGRTGWSALPSSPWVVKHSCLSAYFTAARSVAQGVPNVYAEELYHQPGQGTGAPSPPRKLGPFNVDVFEYPPQFLLLPRALLAVQPDFLRFRMLWFALDGLLILVGLVAVAWATGGSAGARALLLSPLVLAAFPTVVTLQMGNFQPMVIALAMLAMVLFQRRRWAGGGLLLAYATVSKLFPGVLLVYLIARRQWRAVGWTLAASLALTLLALVMAGWSPFLAFREHLPRLMGGESFPALRMPAPIGINDSIPGLVLKLKLLGVPGMSFAVSKAVGTIYSLVLLAVTIVVGRRARAGAEQPLVWLAVLLAATLRSPFLPQDYAVFAPLWLLTLMAALHAPGARFLAAVALTWLALNIHVSIDAVIQPAARMAITAVPQLVILGLAVRALRQPWRTAQG